jgi:hypothetical protein
MPIAPDASTGTREDVDRDIIAAAAGAGSRPDTPSRTSSIISSGGLRGPEHPLNSSGHTNPVPSILYGPSRAAALDKAIVDDLAMKAGALTTVPEVEEYQFQMPTRDESVRAEVARESGLRGRALDQALGYRAAREQQVGRPEQTSDEEAREMSQAERAFKSGMRATRRGVNQGTGRGNSEAMTSAEYAALSPQQKAAVELNSLLLAAAKHDRRVGHESTGKEAKNAEGKEYQEIVEKLFPGEGVSADYAPNTVQVLESIGWTGTGTDLDDILSGKLLFNEQDIADLGPSKGGPDASLNTGEHLRDELQASLVKAFTTARKEPMRGENLLEAKRTLTDVGKMPGYSADEGREVVPGVSLGKFIQSGFDLLANSNSGFTAEQIIADARSNLDDREFQAFLNFVDVNSRDAKKYRQPLGDTAATTYFDPVEFRKSIAPLLRKER